ncbi:VOC family protein [Actinoalloteichus hymeniacidonis]|uniref:Lactoylglutathione lyase n=1 Tax=Actinoalloteichus hymeniacidonis TaxID=340345 RepID=A0AAC9HLB9_9PSEU|nr:VOC family protein [Actinoalloteichus hymeniacidonis]AOS61512.1 putative lactoylglutathione lyase [Actinoalloteichus hymeniacidonis]MBB5910480.1 putative glyoxalase superfamily protein PhnB [Actinoalloteichus hymeniacidonis]
MTLSLDAVTLGTQQPAAAQAFYQAAFSATTDDHGKHVELDLHGAGRLTLHDAASPADGAPASAPGDYLLNVIVDQPSEVETLFAAALGNGATLSKAPKKGLFGGFSGVYQAPDGASWKVAAPTKKDTGPAANPPRPTEVVIILGVADPEVSKVFYEALGLTVDHDYGSKFVDFSLAAGKPRLGLMPHKALAKDAGHDQTDRERRPAMVLNHRAVCRAKVDSLLAAMPTNGEVTAPASVTDAGEYAGYFVDPDGHRWRVAAA